MGIHKHLPKKAPFQNEVPPSAKPPLQPNKMISIPFLKPQRPTI